MTDIGTLREHLARNRFMPVPPPELLFCGDGDFRAIGAEFLCHLVSGLGLQPHHRILDIGCGIGRLALPLTQYLHETGAYCGIDPVKAGIDWCAATITPRYPNAQFQHLDLHHALYNPGGTLETAATKLPFEDGAFDVVCMVSVLTHLDENEALHYAAETARVLAPGGSCLATAFLMNPPARDALAAGQGRLGFDPRASGPLYHADPAAPLAAVAYDEDVLLEFFLRHGLHRRNPAQYGNWSGRAGESFQDLCIFDKAAA